MAIKASIPWIKLPTALLDNTNYNYLLTPTQRDIYIRLYLLAAKLDSLGNLIDESGKQLKAKELAWLLRESTRDTERAIKALRAAGLMGANGHGLFISNFTNEQGELKHSDRLEQWRERQARHRAKDEGEPELDSHATVTRDKSTSHAGHFTKKKKKSKSKSKSKSNSKIRSRRRRRTTAPPAAAAAAAAAAGLLIAAGISGEVATELATLDHVTESYVKALVWTWRQKQKPTTGLLVKMIRDSDTPSYSDYAKRPREEHETDREYHERTIKLLQETWS